ncbi:hypothetical protein N9B72_00270 [Bacteriovoracaceae bacterium]|nr:hypothetical protein [Bacteriovoracaceae bacterium]
MSIDVELLEIIDIIESNQHNSEVDIIWAHNFIYGYDLLIVDCLIELKITRRQRYLLKKINFIDFLSLEKKRFLKFFNISFFRLRNDLHSKLLEDGLISIKELPSSKIKETDDLSNFEQLIKIKIKK